MPGNATGILKPTWSKPSEKRFLANDVSSIHFVTSNDPVYYIENQILSIIGRKFDKKEVRKFLHQGIAGRNFDRRFQLAEHVKVKDAAFADGLLYIDLVREIPDSMKPKSVPIRERNNVLSDVSRRDVA